MALGTFVQEDVRRLVEGLNFAEKVARSLGLIREAFEEHGDKLCVPRQLAALLKMSLQDTCAAFDNICADGWRLRGVTPDEVFEFAKFYGCPCFYFAGGQMQWQYQPEHKLNKALAFTSWEDHAFFLQQCEAHRQPHGQTKGDRSKRHEKDNATL